MQHRLWSTRAMQGPESVRYDRSVQGFLMTPCSEAPGGTCQSTATHARHQPHCLSSPSACALGPQQQHGSHVLPCQGLVSPRSRSRHIRTWFFCDRDLKSSTYGAPPALSPHLCPHLSNLAAPATVTCSYTVGWQQMDSWLGQFGTRHDDDDARPLL